MIPPSPISYFDDPREAKKLRTEALSWEGTPFAQVYPDFDATARAEAIAAGIPASALDCKGSGGGVDCVGLHDEIFSRIGAIEKFSFLRDPADYQSNQTGDKFLDWLRGKIDNPHSKRLSQILVELDVPEAAKDRHAPTPRDFFKPGDILVERHRGLFHLPLIIDRDLHFINALPRLGVTLGTIQDASFSIHLVAAFRLLPRAAWPSSSPSPISNLPSSAAPKTPP